MTHDELLESLNFVWSTDEPTLDKAERLRQALRAVVELHKPRESTRVVGIPNEYGVAIGAAEPSCDAAGCREEYPCRTIQVIEKELG